MYITKEEHSWRKRDRQTTGRSDKQPDSQPYKQRKQKKEETERARICTDVCSVSHRMWQTVLRYTSACRDDTWVEALCRLRFSSSVTRWLILQGERLCRHLHIHLFWKRTSMFIKTKHTERKTSMGEPNHCTKYIEMFKLCISRVWKRNIWYFKQQNCKIRTIVSVWTLQPASPRGNRRFICNRKWCQCYCLYPLLVRGID